MPPEPRVIWVAAITSLKLVFEPNFSSCLLLVRNRVFVWLKFGLPGLLNTHENYSGQFVGRFKCNKLRRNPWNWKRMPTRGRELASPSNVLRKDEQHFY